MTKVCRGDVILIRFDPAVGSEIRKTRPAIVVSNAAACRFDSVLQVVPLTGLPGRDLRPYEARIQSPGSGLKNPSRAVTNQIRTVSRGRIAKRLGQISTGERDLLDRALGIQLGLPMTDPGHRSAAP